MLEVTIKVPTIEELKTIDPMFMQKNIISQSDAVKLAEQGVSIYFAENSVSFSPGTKTAVYNLYVVVGNEDELKKVLKYYYPPESGFVEVKDGKRF